MTFITNININYFEIEKNELKVLKKFGNNKISVNIGFLNDEKNYVVAR